MNHNSNMNAGGESHGRVLPGKHPNKDGNSSAEGAEGRRPTTENTAQTAYGFRPGRGTHDALGALRVGIMRKKINWVLDADIRDCFASFSHEWMVQFLQHRIGDRQVLRLIKKWLRAGVLEEGKWSEMDKGTPQGSVISPLLSNVYLHYGAPG